MTTRKPRKRYRYVVFKDAWAFAAEAREAGMSWVAIAAALDVSGTTLDRIRRAFA